MASRSTLRGQFTFISMLSLDPATVGTAGYREIFQAGEALNGRPLIDRQHPHNFFMQLAAVWRLPVTQATGFTVAGGPAGEPALGPVAFMHRASADDNPTAPLSHHRVSAWPAGRNVEDSCGRHYDEPPLHTIQFQFPAAYVPGCLLTTGIGSRNFTLYLTWRWVAILHDALRASWTCFKLLALGPQREALSPGRLMGSPHWGLPETA
jgi:hypothetical protein